jgi:hypothetical protein
LEAASNQGIDINSIKRRLAVDEQHFGTRELEKAELKS